MIITLGIATVLTILWLTLLFMSGNEDWAAHAYTQVVDNRMEIERLQLRDEQRKERLEQYHGVVGKIMRLLGSKDSKKEINKLEGWNTALQQGNLRRLSCLPMPGYVLIRRINGIGHGNIHKTIYIKCTELYGRKYAEKKAKQLLAKLLSYLLIGVALALAVGSLVSAFSGGLTGILVTIIGVVLVAVLVYAMYDEVSDRVNKRRTAIARQFPNVVSKLALLVTSGMIMERAWCETAGSQRGELYHEMCLTSDELDNLVEPSVAYTNFLNRCNTKETTKLASAIIQNQTKGNAEVGLLLRQMSHEAWQERRHTAKRDSEKANSKLMIPTMLLFVAILVMIMVPVAISFSGI